jgi:hypothetical protein|tara:strand:- start:526 stop:699 length:174 start_codon:yes stop_codon:yes gene_type:complete
MTSNIDESLLQYLEELYPDKAPDLSMEEKQIWFSAGQVAVVRHLKDQFKLQEETKYN